MPSGALSPLFELTKQSHLSGLERYSSLTGPPGGPRHSSFFLEFVDVFVPV